MIDTNKHLERCREAVIALNEVIGDPPGLDPLSKASRELAVAFHNLDNLLTGGGNMPPFDWWSNETVINANPNEDT